MGPTIPLINSAGQSFTNHISELLIGHTSPSITKHNKILKVRKKTEELVSFSRLLTGRQTGGMR